LEVGQSGTAVFTLTPNDAGNIELSFGAWGGQANERLVPDDIRLVACEDLAINP
jgi:hypothetical protein